MSWLSSSKSVPVALELLLQWSWLASEDSYGDLNTQVAGGARLGLNCSDQLDVPMAFKFIHKLMVTVMVTVAVTPTVQGVDRRGHCCLGDRPGKSPEPWAQ